MIERSPIAFARPSIGEDEIRAVTEVLRSGWLTTGRKAQELEAAFAADVGRPHALAVSSCTAALHVALVLRDIGPGDEVIVPDVTCAATINAVLSAGATPVIVDVDPATWNMDAEATAAGRTPRTRALMPVHL